MLLAQNLNAIQGASGVKLPFNDVGGFISLVLNTYVFYVAGILLLIYMVIGGIQIMTSKGDPKAMQAAQGKITNALLGFIIVITAYAIVSILGTALHIDAFKDIFR